MTRSCNVYGPQQKKENLIPHFEFVHKRIMMGLFANEAMLGGEASPYATQAVSMKVVMHRYLMNRIQLEKLIRTKVFLPITMRQGFVKRTKAELDHKVYGSDKTYILPNFFYTQRLNLLSSTAEQEMLLRLRDKGEIPMEILTDVFGWDPNQLKAPFKREQGTELDPAWRDARKDVIKDPDVRNSVLKGEKIADINLPSAPPQPTSPGRPTKPEGEKVKYEGSVIPAGPGEASPRVKMEEKGKLPKPKGEEAIGTTPAGEAPAAEVAAPKTPA